MRILRALIKKEFLQIIRDPSSILIAFILPLMLLLIYRYGINLDTVVVNIGIKNENPNVETSRLVESFAQSKYVKAHIYDNRKEMYADMVRAKINGIVVIPNDFSSKLSRGGMADLQVIVDGSIVNTANYVQSYATMIPQQWLATSKYSSTLNSSLSTLKKGSTSQLITPELRMWFNQEIDSKHFILPGSLAITMTLIGILLTALVMAREWERGTMEALITTRVTRMQILLGKYIPYFILGMLSMAFSVSMCTLVFGVPFRGSYLILFFVSALFLLSSLGIGLTISMAFKEQFQASQAALAIGYMPAMMLSGLMFPINSMPAWIQAITYFIPARYFVSFVESEFLAGSIWPIILINSLYLGLLATFFFIINYRKTKMRLN